MNHKHEHKVRVKIETLVTHLLTDPEMQDVAGLPELVIQQLTRTVAQLALANAVVEGVGSPGKGDEVEVKLAEHVFSTLTGHASASLNKILNIECRVGVAPCSREEFEVTQTTGTTRH